MQNLSFLTFCFFVFAISCNNAEKKNAPSEEKKETATPQSKLDDAGTQKLMTVVKNYYSVKDAMVKIDEKSLQQSVATLNTSASELKDFLAKDAVNKLELPQLDTILLATEAIKTLNPEGIVEKSKVNFEKISDNMFALLKKVELKNAGVYRQYCPMAFDDKGAYWLSHEEEIKNPYFGKKMLECGEVTDSLK